MTLIASRLGEHAAKSGSSAALVIGRKTLSWAELNAHVEHLAAWLATRAATGEGIALHLENGFVFAALFAAICRAGLEAQVLDPAWPRALVAQALQKLRPRLVVTGDAELNADNVLVIAGDELVELMARIGDDSDHAAAAAVSLDRDVSAQTSFYVGLTSGSTGEAKAFRRTHASWLASFDADAREIGLTADDVICAPGSLTHSLFLYALALGFHLGATTLLSRDFKPSSVLQLARERRATVLYGVPTQLQLLLEAGRTQPPLPAMRRVLSSGAKWRHENSSALARLFSKARFAEFYGASETSFIAIAKDDENVPEGSVGRAFHGVTLSIRDKHGKSLGAGMTGRIYAHSAMTFAGYVFGGDASVIAPDGAVWAGDIGHLDDNGFLFIEGRAQRMMIVAGKNIFPEQVERALETHSAVEAAAALAIGDPLRGERCLAVLHVAQQNPSPSAATLSAHLKPLLPPSHIPGRYVTLSPWPLTSSGKTDYAAVEKAFVAGQTLPLS